MEQVNGDPKDVEETQPLIDGQNNINFQHKFTGAKYSRNVHMWSLLGLGVAALAVGGGLGIGLLGRAFSELCSDNICAKLQSYQGCFDAASFVGMALLVYVLPVGILIFGSLVTEFAHKLQRWRKTRVMLALGSLATISLATVVTSWVFLLKPTTVYKTRTMTDSEHNVTNVQNENDPLLAVVGGFIMLTFTPLTIAILVVMERLYRMRRTSFDRTDKDRTESLTPSGVKRNIRPYIYLMLLLVFLALCCATFSAVWNYSAKSYFPATSPYAVVQVQVNDKFVFKLYSDTIVFYGFIGIVATAGCLVHLNRRVRDVMHSRIIIPFLKKYLNTGVSIGEGLLGTLVLVLFVYWLWFWRWGYDRIEKETRSKSIVAACCNPNDHNSSHTCILPEDSHSELQIWARVLGHMTTLSMSLLLLPAARNSVWEYVFGVPFERAVQYHRVLGVVAYTFLTSHMLLWLIKWGIEGTLKNNLWTLDYLQITPELIHYDNFTIILTEITWVLVTIMVFIALFARRNNYELFYYTHHIAIIFYVVAIIHAWSFWYYAVGGLSLWLLDRCLRLVRRCNPVAVHSISVHRQAAVTVVKLTQPNFKYYAGQYIWLNIPCISHLEWHPFTVSSPPSAEKMSLHIKNMGPGTFTNEVMRLTDRFPLDAVQLRVDGPYGRPLYFDEAEHLVLVAGGIGITPMHSILMEIYHRSRASQDIGKIKSVTLVWAVRQSELLHMFDRMLEVTRDNMTQVEFNFSFHVTGASAFASLGPSQQPGQEELVDVVTSYAKAGRPDLMTIGGTFPTGRCTAVMVCGPEAMITSASDMAAFYDFAFHHEVFNF